MSARIAAICATEKGLTRDLTEWALARIAHPVVLFGALEMPALDGFEICFFFTPTWGDAEVPAGMERFLMALDVYARRYVLCEMGNYYGYDEPGFGASAILRARLTDLRWTEAFPSLSLDTVPRVDWSTYSRWVARLSAWRPS